MLPVLRLEVFRLTFLKYFALSRGFEKTRGERKEQKPTHSTAQHGNSFFVVVDVVVDTCHFELAKELTRRLRTNLYAWYSSSNVKKATYHRECQNLP
jgi:hypothetical protein